MTKAPNALARQVTEVALLIRSIRSVKVILDEDIARLYGVETKVLLRAVKRNLDRFPGDFMFQLSPEEFQDLRRQFGTSKGGPLDGVSFKDYIDILICSPLDLPQGLRRGFAFTGVLCQ